MLILRQLKLKFYMMLITLIDQLVVLLQQTTANMNKIVTIRTTLGAGN